MCLKKKYMFMYIFIHLREIFLNIILSLYTMYYTCIIYFYI